MKTHTVVKKLFYIAFCIWVIMAIAGCTSTNSISSLNPTAADPESSINLPESDETRATELIPVVNIIAAKTIAGPGAEISLRAEAIDPAGGAITLAWEASGGTIINTDGHTAIWKAPNQTSAPVIACVATDVRGKQARAELKIDVVGNSTYRLVINADRTSIMAGRVTSDASNPFVPVSGARVEMEGMGEIGVSDTTGMVEFNIDQSTAVATYSLVKINYQDWEASFLASLVVPEGMRIVDNLTFYPGYDSVTVAIARGDSFALKRGMLEITTVENNAGDVKPVAEVTIDAGSGQAVSAAVTGRAILTSSTMGNAETSIRLARNGYQTIEGYYVPVAIDGLTLVHARMARTGSVSDSEAVMSWTRPYNSQNAFPVAGPLEIGFGQPMDKSTIFNNINLMVLNKKTSVMTALTGTEIARDFRVEWKGNTVVQLFPKTPLDASARYSILVSSWIARAADGRMLKSYNGLYYEFTTDLDPSPSIVSLTPRNGQTDVGRNGPFSIRFDRSMLPETLYDNLEIEITSLDNGATLKVTGATIKSYFSITWKESNTLVELVPYMMLRANSSYLIRFNSSGLVSESGKKTVGFEKLWGQFTTGNL